MLFFLNQRVPLDARTLFFDRESLDAQTGPLAPGLQQERLPPETSLQFSQDPRSRPRLSRILFRNRALAWDVLVIYSGIALPALCSRALAGDLLATY